MVMPKILIVTTSHDRLGATGRATGLWMDEFAVPYELFRAAGCRIDVVSPAGGAVPVDPESLREPALSPEGRELAADADSPLLDAGRLAAVRSADYAGVFYPGGHGPMWDLANHCDNARLLREFLDSGKVVGAVCHGPAALIGAVGADGLPVVSGRSVTGFSNAEERAVGLEKAVPFLLEDRLRELGAHYSSAANFRPHVVIAQRLVTGQNPQSAAPVARAMLELLRK